MTFLLSLHRCLHWNKRISAPSHLIGQKGTENKLTYTLWDHSAARKPEEERKSELYHSLVYFTVQQSTQGKQPELNSLNSSDILHLCGAGNALPCGEGITDKREVSAAVGGRVTLTGPQGTWRGGLAASCHCELTFHHGGTGEPGWLLWL